MQGVVDDFDLSAQLGLRLRREKAPVWQLIQGGVNLVEVIPRFIFPINMAVAAMAYGAAGFTYVL